MDLKVYREKSSEQARIAQVLGMLPAGRSTVLDIGARDGYISRRLATMFEHVTALDLEQPDISEDRITPVQGDVTCLEFPDNYFDTVVCLEVLEHIPPQLLESACREIARVARHDVLIGVPYKQDIRVGRTTCSACGTKNPPWGHVNSFDEGRLQRLFSTLEIEQTEFTAENRSCTNALSVWLMDFAGNPYGTYHQEEGCIKCGAKLEAPAHRTFAQKVCTRLSLVLQHTQEKVARPHANWIHLLFSKAPVEDACLAEASQ